MDLNSLDPIIEVYRTLSQRLWRRRSCGTLEIVGGPQGGKDLLFNADHVAASGGLPEGWEESAGLVVVRAKIS